MSKIKLKPYSVMEIRAIAYMFAIFYVVALFIFISIFYFNLFDNLDIVRKILFIMILFLLVPSVLHFLISQFHPYNRKNDDFIFSMRLIHFIYKREPYIEVNLKSIKRVKKYTDLTGGLLLLKVVTDEMIFYLSNDNMMKSVLYRLKLSNKDNII